MTCPRCGSIDVDSTTMGGIIFPGAEAFDDANRSTCQKCHHKGSTGDWERLDKLRASLAAAEVKIVALVRASSRPMSCRAHGEESGGWWCDGCRTAMVSRKLLADAVEIATPSQDTDTP